MKVLKENAKIIIERIGKDVFRLESVEMKLESGYETIRLCKGDTLTINLPPLIQEMNTDENSDC